MITFDCPFCFRSLQAPAQLAGDTARCGGCGQAVPVPMNPQTIGQKPTALYVPPVAQIVATPAPATLPTDTNRAKIVAGCLGITLGFVGAHKFYLGRKWTGATTVALGGLLSPLVGFSVALIMWAIGITEGVLYLTRSDQEFHDNYISGNREWF